MNRTHGSTPRLDALLARLRSTLLRNVWLHGLGTVLAAAAAWLVFMYVSDRVLKLPAAIRWIHLAVLIGGTLVLLRRTLFEHRAKVPSRAGLAMLAQRALPDDVPRDDRFVSALQLRDSIAADSPAASLVARVAAIADESAARAELGRVTDGTGPTRRILVGVLTGVVATAVLAQNPAMARIFAARMVGGDVAWPRDTTLFVEVPVAASGLDVRRDDAAGVISVRAARGSDVPVFARAEGVVPDVVTVTFDSGAVVDVARSGKDTFRTILPSVQENTVVRVTGGDDDRGVPRIEIEVLQPPDLTGLAFQVEPPAYSGLPARLETDTSISVLEGARVTVHVLPDPLDATGIARTFPDDVEISLVAAAFPSSDAADSAGGDSAEGPVTGLAFSQQVLDTVRFRIELTDSRGLENPDPALFGIEAVPDRRPELLTLAPARADVEVVAGGAIPLRFLTRDDFGLGELVVEFRDVATDAVTSSRTLAWIDAPEALASQGRTARAAALSRELIEVSTLAGDALLAEGSVVVVQARATDNRQPEPNETLSGPVRVRVVSADEFLRGQRDGLGRAAEDVGAVDGRLESTLLSLGEFQMVTSGDDAEVPDAGRVAAVCNEARRVRGDLESVTRDLAALASSMIYARIDERAGVLESRLWELTSGSAERTFQPDSWRTLHSDLTGGRLGTPGRAGELVRVVGLALDAAGPRADAWIGELEAVRNAGSLEDARTALAAAMKETESLRETIVALGSELGEWDSMQSILSLTRDILNRQKNVKEKAKRQTESNR